MAPAAAPTDGASPAQDALRVITAEGMHPPRLARWVPWTLGAAGLLSLIALPMPLPSGWVWAPAAMGMISSAVLASWAERRVHHRLRSRSRQVRVIANLLQPLFSLAATVLVTALLVGLLPAPLATLTAPPIAFGGLWYAGAALGTSTLSWVDAIVRRVVGSFRARLVWVTFVLVLGGYVVAMAVGLGAVELYPWVLADPDTVSRMVLRYAGPGDQLSLDALTRYLAQVRTGVLSLAGLLALPAVISACGKAADTAMELLRPLGEALRRVGRGERNVRVQMGGSLEFAELAQTFNGMVRALGMAERMERAFGAYVSGHLLERIRAQHGEAALPPALREATVFFADIRGFTRLSERLSPEAVVGVLNRYFESVVELVEAHQGYLNKFIGDAVVVVFNGPLDQHDHAERAVRCALALQELVDRLNLEQAFPEVGRLEIGVGICTGPMLCGNIGSARQMEYTVIGDAVNVASRLTDLAPPGEVWASERTIECLPPESVYQALPLQQVKGKDRPLQPYRVHALPGAAAGSTVPEHPVLDARRTSS